MAGVLMITELEIHEFYKVKPMMDQCRNLEARAVVNGMNPGFVYVDHETAITATIVWVQGQSGFHIAGDPRSESFITGLETYMINEIEPRLKKLSIDAVEISVENDLWAEALHMIFRQRSLFSDNQYVYKINDFNSDEPISKHLEDTMIQRLDRDLFESSKYENRKFLEQKITSFWDSKEKFLQYGIGYMAEHKNKIVGLCFSAFVVDRVTCGRYRNTNRI